jgi:hypothetical protein
VLVPLLLAGRSIIPVVILFSLLTHDCYLEFCCDFSGILANRNKLKIKSKVFSTRGRRKHVTTAPINLTFRNLDHNRSYHDLT